ncbi:deoxynucleoside kinase [Candidatus Woesearchaeota archaeon]|nr:deoxynucleoside kinase [Candidatus Woesearchaeota archaeon]
MLKVVKLKKGKIIVIEGTDGTGKATQSARLKQRLTDEGYSVKEMDFPRHGEVTARQVDDYLMGKYGPPDEFNPYAASVFYAWNRYMNSSTIKKWLEEGNVVVLDRYTTANHGHQAGKIKDKKERDRFRKWLDLVEYDMMGLPKPDLCIVLHVTPEQTQQLIMKKKNRTYTKGQKMDGHENNLEHLKNSEMAFLELAEMYDYCTLIECAPHGELLSIEEIHKLVWEKVKEIL